ncbi:hypothetical protein Taro_047550 [Colocasia esculenta]|uniref:Uncharacterized protein n=1 Tax=Colocasia esculenta TaxID=4460 RepID=A0A843X129_COLES|nr:hypothetical protein [Colocasia esculenta]
MPDFSTRRHLLPLSSSILSAPARGPCCLPCSASRGGRSPRPTPAPPPPGGIYMEYSSLAPHRSPPRVSPCGSRGTPTGLREVHPPRSPQRVVASGRRTATATGKHAFLGAARVAAAPAGLGLAARRRLLGGEVVFRGRRRGPFKVLEVLLGTALIRPSNPLFLFLLNAVQFLN